MAKEFLEDSLRVFVVPVEILEVNGINIYEKMAYIVIRSHCNVRGNSAFPSYNTIAREGSMSRSSAIRAVESLLQKGLLKKELRLDVSKNRKVKNTSNNYTLNHPSNITQCPTDTNLVSHRHQPSVPQTPEHNHLTESLKDDDLKGHYRHSEFMEIAKEQGIPPRITKAIFKHIKNFLPEMKSWNSVYAAIDRMKEHSHSINSVGPWFAQTLKERDELIYMNRRK